MHFCFYLFGACRFGLLQRGVVVLICVLRCACQFVFVCLLIVLVGSSVLMVCLIGCYYWF